MDITTHLFIEAKEPQRFQLTFENCDFGEPVPSDQKMRDEYIAFDYKHYLGVRSYVDTDGMKKVDIALLRNPKRSIYGEPDDLFRGKLASQISEAIGKARAVDEPPTAGLEELCLTTFRVEQHEVAVLMQRIQNFALGTDPFFYVERGGRITIVEDIKYDEIFYEHPALF